MSDFLTLADIPVANWPALWERTWARSGSSMSSGSTGSVLLMFGSELPARPLWLYGMWHAVQPDERKSP